MVTKAWWCPGVVFRIFVYQSACDHYRNLQLSFAKNTAAIEKWNMLYDSFILNFNICMWFSLEIIDSHAFCNEIVRLFLSSMGAAILNHFPPSRESDWKRFYESTPRVAKIMRSRETFSLNLQWRCENSFCCIGSLRPLTYFFVSCVCISRKLHGVRVESATGAMRRANRGRTFAWQRSLTTGFADNKTAVYCWRLPRLFFIFQQNCRQMHRVFVSAVSIILFTYVVNQYKDTSTMGKRN